MVDGFMWMFVLTIDSRTVCLRKNKHIEHRCLKRSGLCVEKEGVCVYVMKIVELGGINKAEPYPYYQAHCLPYSLGIVQSDNDKECRP